jgi:SAM-dependent methyltransferase
MRMEDVAWQDAVGQLEGFMRSAEALALLRATERSGLLSLLAAPREVSQVAAALGLASSRAFGVLEMLRAHGVLSSRDGTWELTAGWAALVGGQTPVSLEGSLGLSDVRVRQMGASLTGQNLSYEALSERDRLLVATGVSINPFADVTVRQARSDLEKLDGVAAALDDGGRLLELGCGLGSRLCAILQAFPGSTAVGVELAPELVRYGRERAARCGVGDRLTFVSGDASTYQPEPGFAFATWSQFFFPEPSRAGTLATARRALAPGGWISTPVIWRDEPPDPVSADDQDLAAELIVMDHWGVPPRTVEEVRHEVEAAGFVDVQAHPTPMVTLVRGRQPS